jgi:hypothetical protein
MSKKQKSVYKPTYKGLPLVDATEDLDIEVKKGDISTARKKSPEACAMANAGKRVLQTEVEVHMSRIYVKKNNKWIRYMTPERTSREITSFDRGSIFEPGDYTFKAPSHSAQLGKYVHRGGKRGESGKQIKHRITMNVREAAKNDVKTKTK